MFRSLLAQSNPNFICVPLMDFNRTPHDLQLLMDSFTCDNVIPMWFDDSYAVDGIMYDDPPLWKICEKAVRDIVGEPEEGYLITTRVDSDDALHEDFVQEIQNEARPDVTEWLNINLGWAEKDGKVYPDEHGKNMFISLVEPVGGAGYPLTVHRVWHKRASSLAPIRQIAEGKRLWLRGIHSENRSSVLRGRNRQHEPIALTDLEGFIWK
jgi:hypothetical protein